MIRKRRNIYNKHRKLRVYIGPRTSEIAIRLGRNSLEGVPEDYKLTLEILAERRFRCRSCRQNLIIEEYGTRDGAHLFSIEGEFFSDWPRGLYFANIWHDDCLIDKIEIVKSSWMYAERVYTNTDACIQATDYVEPTCERKCIDNVIVNDKGCGVCDDLKYKVYDQPIDFNNSGITNPFEPDYGD